MHGRCKCQGAAWQRVWSASLCGTCTVRSRRFPSQTSPKPRCYWKHSAAASHRNWSGGGTVDPLLKALTEAFGPSGNEEEVRDILTSELEQVADGLEVCAMRNLLVHRKGESDGPKGMIAAHMDEIGLIIDHVDDDGLLYFKKVGGIDDRVLPSTRVKVGQNRLPGVIGVPPKHLE